MKLNAPRFSAQNMQSSKIYLSSLGEVRTDFLRNLNSNEQIKELTAWYHPGHRHAVADFAAQCCSSGVLDLMRTNPALVLMLVYEHEFGCFGEDPWKIVSGWVKERQSDISRRLRGAPWITDSIVRVLKKTIVYSTKIRDFLLLRDIVIARDNRTNCRLFKPEIPTRCHATK